MSTKQAINKSERLHILRSMVAASTVKGGSKVLKEVRKLRNEVEQALIQNWTAKVPEITRARQLELLQDRVVERASLANTYVRILPEGAKTTNNHEFAYHSWNRPRMAEGRKDIQAALFCSCESEWLGSNDLLNSSWYSFFVSFKLPRSFSAVPAGYVGTHVVDPAGEEKLTMCPRLNAVLYKAHFRAVKLFKELQEILDQAWELYETLEVNLAPVKSVTALLALMPEAAKHLPESLKQEKPQKELVDPTAINEIRKKLKEGLPI